MLARIFSFVSALPIYRCPEPRRFVGDPASLARDNIIGPLDNFGTVVGENPDCLLLSGTVVGENPDHVYWGD